ncbi:hypothetical protein B5V88_13690 [Heyndrickxia sporothermodurans]|uniref:Uncharacterized protein n=3 Tax=Heyndrickxia sporothermodurans TaxID=46224 RepID=A0AB37HBR1_9BACI|nr:hypothetical protein [Heyndrickxia sporothermodurans]MBL5767205.1 hypothetical protein [Heyndrickxia sporothermodurans]MBL5770704.1 hypothetical protein [Heyndrickxia sporothermodurans]MBL5774436.1 hypothetical protein [Heyndrickxia sporothermodurans]MBL5777983.1 hypothetical protein [Heyndrickxia sporothermodurans]MBL5781591.1 hypothetical protein [Heyndrickxia sporothermodurans]
MTIFILFLSIILNIITIFAIIILYLRQNRLLTMDHSQKQTMKEMEDIFTAYIEELKDENEQFINKFKSIQNEQNSDEAIEKTSHHHPSIEKRTNEVNEVNSDNYNRMYAAKSYQNSVGMNKDLKKEVQDETGSLIDKVIFLQKKGLTNDEIAKKLNKGKTEIELMVKFQQKSLDKLD